MGVEWVNTEKNLSKRTSERARERTRVEGEKKSEISFEKKKSLIRGSFVLFSVFRILKTRGTRMSPASLDEYLFFFYAFPRGKIYTQENGLESSSLFFIPFFR